MLRNLPRPDRDADSEPFWRGCDEGRLLLQRCGRCAAYRWPPGPVCASCGSRASDWVESGGRGEVFSWVVVHVPLAEVLADQLPYAVGLVQLEEGVRIVSTIEGCEPDGIAAGMPVEVRFDAGDGRARLPAFVPRAAR